MNKKVFAIVGMVVSGLVILMGLLAMGGSLGGNGDFPSGTSYLYDSGYASFGGDFYSYVNNNAAEAADAAATTARNVRELCELMRTVSGGFLMGFGAMGLCYFGIQFCDEKKKMAVAPAAAAIPEIFTESQNIVEPEPHIKPEINTESEMYVNE